MKDIQKNATALEAQRQTPQTAKSTERVRGHWWEGCRWKERKVEKVGVALKQRVVLRKRSALSVFTPLS